MINISALMLGIAIDSNFSANVLYTRRTEPQKGWGSGSGGGRWGTPTVTIMIVILESCLQMPPDMIMILYGLF